MPGVPRELAEHKLRVDPKARPVKESLRRFSSEKRKAIGQEIARLLVAGFIKEIFHSEWLAKPVMVPLPRIDQIVDSTSGCERLCFLDAYSGYHQIRLY